MKLQKIIVFDKVFIQEMKRQIFWNNKFTKVLRLDTKEAMIQQFLQL